MSLLRKCIIQGVGLADSVICPGKQALKGACSQAVEARNGWRFEASVNLDDALQKTHPNQNRWDYGLEIVNRSGERRLEWVEFHPACSSEVDTVIKKKKWLEAQLARTRACPRPGKKNLHWVATSDIYIDPVRQRRLNLAGMALPQKHFRLPLP